MALPVLDGNQTATTLSSVVTGGEHIVAHSVVSLGPNAISDITSAVSGSNVTVAGTVTIGAIGGAVTIPVRLFAEKEGEAPSGQDTLLQCNSSGALLVDLRAGGESAIGFDGDAFLQVKQVQGSSVTIGSLPAISGTVTVSNATPASAVFVKICGESNGGGPNEAREIQTDNSGLLYVRLAPSNALASDPVIYDPVAGTAYINVRQQAGTSITVGNSVTIGSLPSGALTTRFGSVTTANTAQITSAVTNTSRKYLLAQNISTGSVTIGIGFSPTTTQGIQLTAGGGLTFDAFCPTGAVYWLGAVTGAAFTILEG